eukprot:COSAG06_NODE_20469_length_794_cov_1.253237_1_plen_102_part_10
MMWNTSSLVILTACYMNAAVFCIRLYPSSIAIGQACKKVRIAGAVLQLAFASGFCVESEISSMVALLLLLLHATLARATSSACKMTPVRLRVNNLADPLGVP